MDERNSGTPKNDPRAERIAAARSGDARQPAGGQRKRRRMKKTARRMLGLFLAVVLMLGLAWVITGMIQNWSKNPDAVTSGSMAGGAVDKSGMPTPPPVDNSSWNFVGPVQQNGEGATILSPDKRMIALPENGRIDASYFNTAVFVGDSITQGLQTWSVLPNAKYCAYQNVGPKQIYDGTLWTPYKGEVPEVPMDALVAHNPDNVYVLLGTNAMVGMDNESLLGYYNDMLDVMKERLGPEVNIYVQSITPVVQGVDSRFNFDDIKYLNDMLARMAWEKGLYFLDLHEALAGDDGWLRPEYGAEDGYHMQPGGYAAWVEYLVTHTAYSPKHAHLYLEGSHYYTQTP